MKPLTCAAAKRRIQAFHDGELGVTDQIAVGAHLEWCDECAALLADLRVIHVTLGATAPSRAALTQEEAAAFNSAVVARAKAEQDASLITRFHRMLDDPHLVYAACGAMVAAMACVVVMLSMMRFATNERPDSLAAIVSLLATPLECESGADVSGAQVCPERWAERFQRANEAAEQDAVFTLESILTTETRLQSFAAVSARGGRAPSHKAKLIEGLLDAVSRARLESGQAAQAPAANGGMLWLVARETVRATKPVALDVPLPPKKRAASLPDSMRLTRA